MKDSKRAHLCSQALDAANLRGSATKLRQVAMRMKEIEHVVDRWMADQVTDAVAIRSIVSIVEGKVS